MKLTILTLAFVLLAVLPQAMATEEAKSSVKAVMFFSENCGSCKILDPKFKAAMGVVNQDKIKFVKLDFTDNTTSQAALESAKEHNVENIVQQFGSKTGFISIVNNEGEIVGKITKSDSEADIAAKLTKAALKAS